MQTKLKKHKNQKIKKQINNKKTKKSTQENGVAQKSFFFLCYIAIAGVSSPNCGDKVEVQLLFMAFNI